MRKKALTIIEAGNPILRKKARPILASQVCSKKVVLIARHLIHASKRFGGVGISAPQIGLSLQIALINIGPTKRRPHLKKFGPEIMINPIISFPSRNRKATDWEGCLSIPGVFGLVTRPNKVRVKYIDGEGLRKDRIFSGFESRVVQHEYDHLKGILFIDEGRLRQGSLVTEKEWMKIMKKKERPPKRML